jgi:DNA-binding NarL/FixJ family response regulator
MLTPSTQCKVPGLVKRQIFVVDDHPIVRRGLAQLIDCEADLQVCGQGEDVDDSFKAIKTAVPDLVLLDISLGDGDGVALLKRLRALDADLPVLMLSMHDESLYAERALRAGANGYVMKQEAPEILLAAIRRVLCGQIYLSDKMGKTLLKRMIDGPGTACLLPMDRLTDRELAVFRMIGAGLSVREIALKLHISSKTVEAHREHLKQKLNTKTSTELFRFAVRNCPDN